MDIFAYEMEYYGNGVRSEINLIKFNDMYWENYKNIYNECFYDMRKILDIKPYNFYNSIEQIKTKKSNIFLFIINNDIVGSVAICKNEIDDLIINKEYQGRGYGKKILLFAIKYMQTNRIHPIKLHVAKWNEKAVMLYEKNGFKTIKVDKIR